MSRVFVCTVAALVGMGSALVVAGCGSNDNTETIPHVVLSNSVPSESSPSVDKPAGAVTVHEKEFTLQPAALNGGDEGIVKIFVVNDGKRPHSLAIDGPNGRVDIPSGNLEPGQSATFEVDLDEAGSYTMWCPLDHHRARGMIGTITVGGSRPARAGEGKPTVVTTTETTETESTGTDTSGTDTSGGDTSTGTATVTETVTTPTPTAPAFTETTTTTQR